MNPSTNTRLIKAEAARLGFSFVGVARAEHMEEEARRLEAWLNAGLHGRMQYMENHFDKRVDPTKLVPGAKSVISLLYNYYTEAEQTDPEAPKISKYAYGEDYHFVIKRKLKDLLAFIHEEVGEVNGRVFVDSAPVLERDWAKRAGNGWVGKNTLLIHPRAGSYFFLAELILDLELEPDGPLRDYCGTCRRCIDACPTDAISENGYILDGSRCISYLTIELREAIPGEFREQMDNWMFGCDVCQQVCPWNRFARPHEEPAFEPRADLLGMKRGEWEELTAEVFRELFRHSAVKRTKYEGLKRNIEFLPVYLLLLLLLGACRADKPAPEAAPAEPGQPGKLICFGDDFVAGYGLQPAENFPGLVRQYIDSLGYNWRIVNAGITNETSTNGNERVEWVLQHGVDVFILALGYNDPAAGISHRGTYENLRSIARKVRDAAPQARIVLVSPPTPPGAGPAFDEVFTSLASAEEITLIPNLYADLRGNPALLLPDGVHPNARGIRRLVEQQLWPVLQPVLQE